MAVARFAYKNMPNNSRILAIDPGTREMGVALLDSAKLIYHGVKEIKKTGDHPTRSCRREER